MYPLFGKKHIIKKWLTAGLGLPLEGAHNVLNLNTIMTLLVRGDEGHLMVERFLASEITSWVYGLKSWFYWTAIAPKLNMFSALNMVNRGNYSRGLICLKQGGRTSTACNTNLDVVASLSISCGVATAGTTESLKNRIHMLKMFLWYVL